MLLSNTTDECFNSTKSIVGRDLYLTKLISDIGDLATFLTATESAAIIMKFLLSQIYWCYMQLMRESFGLI